MYLYEFSPGVNEVLLKGGRILIWGFPCGSLVKNLPANAGDMGSTPGQKDPLGKEWQPTPVFLSGEPHGERSLVCYSPWGCKKSDTT